MPTCETRPVNCLPKLGITKVRRYIPAVAPRLFRIRSVESPDIEIIYSRDALRRKEDWVRTPGNTFPNTMAFPTGGIGSAPPSYPTSVPVGIRFLRCSVRFRLRPAELLVLLYRSDLELPPANKDLYTQACPKRGQPLLELSMTTRHPRVDTRAGLTPARTPPLQAAPCNGTLDKKA
jgi:hypothetical protein